MRLLFKGQMAKLGSGDSMGLQSQPWLHGLGLLFATCRILYKLLKFSVAQSVKWGGDSYSVRL